jgi:HTH-like domain
MAFQVWWHADQRREENEDPGGREFDSQENPRSKGTRAHRDKGGAVKKVVTVAEKREAAAMMTETGLSERKTCELLDLSRSSLRYKPPRTKDDSDLREKIRTIAFNRRRFGYRRITAKIREGGDKVNAKRVYRRESEGSHAATEKAGGATW